MTAFFNGLLTFYWLNYSFLFLRNLFTVFIYPKFQRPSFESKFKADYYILLYTNSKILVHFRTFDAESTLENISRTVVNL